jgi:aminopeptidase N
LRSRGGSRDSSPVRRLWIAIVVTACHRAPAPSPDAAPPGPTANPSRPVIDTRLNVDYGAMTAVATISFGPSDKPGASLEIGNLTIDTVQHRDAPIVFATNGSSLELGIPADSGPFAVDISYQWQFDEGFTGASKNGYTLDWPYYCGNVFPCHSDPADGTTFAAGIGNIPAGMVAVYPDTIPSAAPSYQFAWSIDAYQQIDLGTTTAGTLISVWVHAGEEATARAGTAHLVAAFDWLEQTLGPYTFGPHYGSVSVRWPRGAFGGMEHHPYSHIAAAAIGDETTNVHESAHGWFGDGIRIACWEDFVLSEGTVSYLAARALDVVAPSVGAQTWQGYQTELAAVQGSELVWPQTCGQVDILKANLFTNAPYMRGAFFYKAVADKLGDPAMLDRVLAKFYKDHASGTARMADMLAAIRAGTGYDPTACAQTWLLGTTTPTPGPCP